MGSPILVTKLFVPATRPEIVARPRLIEQLNGGQQKKLSLICAPAGFGKTTLVTEWLSEKGDDTRSPYFLAWVSLDENDNDPVQFLTYLVEALNRVEGFENRIGDAALRMLRSSQPLPGTAVLATLINEIANLQCRLILVLDDYHLIESQAVHETMTFLIENLPPQLHLVIATREDPLLPLSRLRARNQLSEIRASDLRFSSAEAADFLNLVMGLELSPDQISALEIRTEGWIAGLQLAAISLKGQTDTARLIETFTGSNRLVLDYLIEEVLQHQPEPVQDFLLRTALLDHLTGSLCDALTGQEDGQRILEILDRSNLFIVPLDNERCWYRYHHLFADLLRQRLRQTNPDQISILHLKASQWYQEHGLWSDAIHHAFAMGNLERVVDLTEVSWRPMNEQYKAVTWLGWVKKLPEDLVCSRPALCTGCGWASLDAGDLEAAESYFQNAEHLLKSTKILDEDTFRSLTISVANGRAYLAQALGDVNSTLKYTHQATYLLRENDYFEKGLSEILSGFAYWVGGDLEMANEAVANAIVNMQKTGNLLFVSSFTSYLADIMISQGRLNEAVRTYLELLELTTEWGGAQAPETAVSFLGLSELYLEQGEIDAAIRNLRRGEELGELPWFAPWYRHWVYAHLRVLQAQGDLERGLKILNGAERLFYRHPIPDVRPLAALKARAHLALNKLTDALKWVQMRGLSVDDPLSYLQEFEHITLARVLIAQFRENQEAMSVRMATNLLERLLNAAEEGSRMGSVIEIRVLKALLMEAQDDTSAAVEILKQALSLAEPQGYAQIFVSEGLPMARLLYKALSNVEDPDYIQHLLALFPKYEPESSASSESKTYTTGYIEPLSERELDVLLLIADGLTNQEIASQLYLSLNTVKAHTRSIYGKLGVNNRTQASTRARALGLISDN